MEKNKPSTNFAFHFFLTLLFTSIFYQTSSAQNLSTDGLYHKDFIDNIYQGDFIEIPFNRDELIFAALFNSYVTAYAKACNAYLPYNKIELMRPECVTERVTKDSYGWEISRTCVEWVDVGTGLFASPELNEAKLQLDQLQETDAFRNVWGVVMNPDDPIANASNYAGETKAAQTDMAKLIQLNGCTSQALKQFEENLRLFSLNQQSTQFTTNLTSSSGSSSSAVSSANHNYSKLLEDLVYSQSTAWKMNRYIRGSVSGLSILEQDAQNRPTKVHANYSYEGFFGASPGTVIVTFNNGIPDCIYFHDYPTACRTPDRQLVAEFIKGSYLDK